jgi:hypothetical protein
MRELTYNLLAFLSVRPPAGKGRLCLCWVFFTNKDMDPVN